MGKARITKTKSKTKKKIAKKKITKKVAKKKAITKKAAKTASPQPNARLIKKQTTALVRIGLELNKFINAMTQMEKSLSKFIDSVGPVLESVLPLNENVLPLDKFQANTQTVAAPVNTTEPAQTDMFDETPEQTTPDTKKLAKEDIKLALEQVMSVSGQPKVKEILESVKATRISDIKESDWGTVWDACRLITSTPDTKAASTQNAATSLF